MTKLTEDMVIARTRTSDLGSIKKFNCWGSDLHDISIIKKFTGVEVLSLSLNRISTLADFQYCQNLVELYIRRNEIADLSELCYLQENPKLKRLLLTENPCVDTVGPMYRATVLRCLPNLENLDGEDVTPEEVDHAMQTGLILQHPLAPKRNQSPEPVYYRESPSVQSQSVQRNQYEYENESYSQTQQYRPVSHSPPLEYHYYNANNSKASDSVPNLPAGGSSPTNSSNNQSNGLTARSSNTNSSSDSISQNSSPTNVSSKTTENVQNPPLQRRISSPDYGRGDLNGRRQSADYNYEVHNEQQYFDSHPVRINNGPPHSARDSYSNNNVRTTNGKSRTKTSNLLSAVLCLVPELDYASLEVVELAVRRRMNELDGD